MRWVSWIVVVGALGWLLYGQLGPRLTEVELPGVPPRAVSGTVAPRGPAKGEPPTVPEPTLAHAGSAVAVLSYASILPLLEASRSTQSLDRVEAVATVHSRLPGVAPSDIELSLDDGEVVHRFPVGTHGEVELPVQPGWAESGAQLVTNQPPNSMDLQLTVHMHPPPSRQVDYAWLWESMGQVDEALDRLARAGASGGEVIGVQFEFAPGTAGAVRIGAGDAARVLHADASGVLSLPLDPDRLAANPAVALEPMPRNLRPLLAADDRDH